jgi:hypothetical protein
LNLQKVIYVRRKKNEFFLWESANITIFVRQETKNPLLWKLMNTGIFVSNNYRLARASCNKKSIARLDGWKPIFFMTRRENTLIKRGWSDHPVIITIGDDATMTKCSFCGPHFHLWNWLEAERQLFFVRYDA